mmetsp:Transcript_27410/g.68770  ORF Transcript_27410/g.68770 Transcript_27410/m.68770 type:complete len:114 (-) Transcript_27410:77-418(-)
MFRYNRGYWITPAESNEIANALLCDPGELLGAIADVAAKLEGATLQEVVVLSVRRRPHSSGADYTDDAVFRRVLSICCEARRILRLVDGVPISILDCSFTLELCPTTFPVVVF